MKLQDEFKYLEELTHSILVAYGEYLTQHSENQVEYAITITTHKAPSTNPDKLNADVAYLRLVKLSTPKDQEETDDEKKDWREELIFNVAHEFSSMQERVSDPYRWKIKLYSKTFAQLFKAGLEYADLLKKLKQQDKEVVNTNEDVVNTNEDTEVQDNS